MNALTLRCIALWVLCSACSKELNLGTDPVSFDAGADAAVADEFDADTDEFDAGTDAAAATELETTAVTAGGAHTCALKSDGTVWCWGDNSSGQLGAADIYSSPAPVAVSRLSDMTAVAAGDAHTCALKKDGTVACWGDNSSGQLGAAGIGSSPAPVVVIGLSSVTAVAAGGSHTCAVKSDGAVACWGKNESGQLGNGTVSESSSIPVEVSGLSNVAAVAVGSYSHTCAVKRDGTVWCWGASLGIDMSPTPVAVNDLSEVIAVTAGYFHTCAVKRDGTVWCWGYNGEGQLGDEGFDESWSATPVMSDLSNGVGVSAGAMHTCAVKRDGTVWCWGSGPGPLPIAMSGLSGVAEVTTGGNHTCALKNDGTVWCWGSNESGQLGDGTDPLTPRAVNGVSGATAVTLGRSFQACVLGNDGKVTCRSNFDSFAPVEVSGATSVTLGEEHACALQSGGTVACWGGYPAEIRDSSEPVAVSGLSGVTAVTTGSRHTCALKSDGTVWCWGNKDFGQLGDGGRQGTVLGNSSIPMAVRDLSGVTAIAAGYFHTCALQSDETVWCWGYNGEGQLGGEGFSEGWSATPVMSSLSDVVGVSVAEEYTCAVKSDGTVWCWGSRHYYDQGNSSSIPWLVPGLSGAVAVSAGGEHACALQSDGTVWCWGGWSAGFGDGNPAPRAVNDLFEQYGGAELSNVTAVAAGGSHTCALKSDGTVWCWGKNFYGQPGDDTVQDSPIPVAVSGLSDATAVFAHGGWGTTCASKSDETITCWGYNGEAQLGTANSLPGAIAVAVGGGHICARKSDGTVACWGKNESGQLGDGLAWWDVPVTVSGLSGVIAVTSRGQRSCALKSDGALWCWSNGTAPQEVMSGLSGVTSLSEGGGHTCARQSDGRVWCWGNNSSGQLGDGTTAASSTPVAVSDFFNAIAVAAGDSHTCALKSTGTVWCWGDNSSGQLGNGTTTASSTPVLVNALPGVTAVAVSALHTCALKSDGTVWCWGKNTSGQLGSEARRDSSTPVQVIGLSDAIAVAAGEGYTCAVRSDGTLWCWGRTFDNTGSYSSAPVQVTGLKIPS